MRHSVKSIIERLTPTGEKFLPKTLRKNQTQTFDLLNEKGLFGQAEYLHAYLLAMREALTEDDAVSVTDLLERLQVDSREVASKKGYLVLICGSTLIVMNHSEADFNICEIVNKQIRQTGATDVIFIGRRGVDLAGVRANTYFVKTY